MPARRVLAEDLRRFLVGEPIRARPVGRRNPVVAGSLTGTVLVLVGAVALDEGRRMQVEQILGQGLQAPRSTPEQRLDIALTLAQVGIQDSVLAEKAATTLSQAITKTTDRQALHSLAEGLSAVATRLEPKEAAATPACPRRETPTCC
jgi:hypothetical protein